MNSQSRRSQEVIEDYKKRKLAGAALNRIHEIIHGFEQERAGDRKLAWVGIAAIAVILAVAAFFLLGADSVTLS